MRRATVVSSEAVSPGFQLITLGGPELKGVDWTAGQKVQIAMGSAFVARTFTPVEWDPIEGQTRIVTYAHGHGPGSDWVRGVKPGDTCDVFGPRGSLDVTGLRGPAVVFGDETSFGLALAIARLQERGPVQYLFEVNAADTARSVLKKLDIDKFELFTRTPNDDHLGNIEPQLTAPATSGATFVLTGKATSIQRLRRSLKTLNVPSARVMTRA